MSDPNDFRKNLDDYLRKHGGKRLNAFHDLDDDGRLQLAIALLKRPLNDRWRKGIEMVQRKYPSAPTQMHKAIGFHAYADLPIAMRDSLAWLELCLRDGEHDEHNALNFDLLSHLYNWLQVESFMPWIQQDVCDELREIKGLIGDDDREAALKELEELLDRLEGQADHPQIRD